MKLFLTPLKSGLLAEVQMPAEPRRKFLRNNSLSASMEEIYKAELKEYESAKLKAIENAILLADESQEWARDQVYKKYYPGNLMWQPTVGVIYEIDVDVEREVKTEPHYDGRPNGGNQRQVVLYKTKAENMKDLLTESFKFGLMATDG